MMGLTRVTAQWNRVRSTYWFVPSLMTVTAIGLAFLTLYIDQSAAADAAWLSWVYGGGADGARALLSAVASSSITVVSLTFSVTIVALTVSAQHFGPRLLTNFMRDTAAHVVLGMLIGTFAFCLIVLRKVRGEGDAYTQFVPHLSVTAAVVLALLSVAALIYYLHHVAASMQVSQIILRVTRDFEGAIERLYPEAQTDEVSQVPAALPEAPRGAEQVRAHRSGYVQAIDLGAAVSIAKEHQVKVWLWVRPGDFAVVGTPLAAVAPTPVETDRFADALRGAYVFGSDRTAWQDAEFAVQQLVEVALHALSPGINEPFTAITCIDRLGQGLSLLADRRLPAAILADDAGDERVVAPPKSFVDLLTAAFDPIALQARGDPRIYVRLLQALAGLLIRAHRQEDCDAIRALAAAIRDLALMTTQHEPHRRTVEEHYSRVSTPVAEQRCPPRAVG
jgi:uncharacterized membrane protein